MCGLVRPTGSVGKEGSTMKIISDMVSIPHPVSPTNALLSTAYNTDPYN